MLKHLSAALLVVVLASALTQAAEIQRVEPAVISPQTPTEITFVGDGFARTDVPRVGGVPLTEVQLIDGQHLRGRTPPLAEGTHSVDVLGASGGVQASLRDALVVRALDAQETAIEELKGASRTPVRTSFEHGFPTFVTGRIPVAGATSSERAKAFLDVFGDLYGLDGADSAVKVRRVLPGDDGDDDVAFFQTYKGIPVFGAHLMVGLDGGEVRFTLGRLLGRGARIDTRPRISEEEADEIARSAVGRGGPADVVGETRLMIFDASLFLPVDSSPRLAWRVTLGRRHAWRVLVDAHTGEALLTTDLAQDSGGALHGFDLSMLDAQDMANATDNNCFSGSGALSVATESGFDPSNDYSSDMDATQGFQSIKDTYAYYHENFNRHSYDAGYAQISLYIHSTTTGNARWSGGCKLIEVATGQISPETLTHELTHAVIGATSNLEYSFESGALNESYADTMAVIADRMLDGANANWTYAEGKTNGGGPVRDFADPSKSGPSPCGNCATQVDHYWNIDYGTKDSDGEYPDNGNVHKNSGIPNKAAFLMVQGGNHGGIIVSGGLTLAKLRQLKWRAMTHLPPNARIHDARDYEVLKAEFYSQYGLYNFTDADVCIVKNAWAAVGVGKGDYDCDGTDDPYNPDNDYDGKPDAADNCPAVPNPTQKNSDYDFAGDACDPDLDGDGVPNGIDTCPSKFNPAQGACNDFDNDKIADDKDNCIADANPAQTDSDGDGEGDACEHDGDGDGVNVPEDNCPVVANANQADSDGDGFGDACDKCPSTKDPIYAFTFSGQPYQPDSDGDGIPDACDRTFFVDGIAGSPLVLRPVGRPGSIDVEPFPQRIVPIPIEACPRVCPDGYDPELVFEALLDGLADGITAWISDDEGTMLDRTHGRKRSDSLRFRPEGGRKYYMNIGFEPNYPSPDPVRIAYELFANEDPAEPATFRRGDSNGDGKVDLSDSVRTFGYLFLGAGEPTCLDAADTNDDGRTDISDGIFPLNFLFLGGAPLPDPGSENCGLDPTDSIGCESYTSC